MSNIEICNTYPSDFEKIYPLLLLFNSPYSQETWKRIFTYQWGGAKDYIGYHLEKNGDPVGFMGLIFSERNNNNKKYFFCNITSLIVKPEYRAHTILFIRKLLSYQNIIFTGLGPIQESYRLLTTIGFVHLEYHYKILPAINGFFTKKKITFDQSESLLKKLDNENKRLALDHAHLNCQFILFEYRHEQCFIIFHVNKQKYYGKKINKIHVRFISNIIFFNTHILNILNIFRKYYGLFSALYVDGRFFDKNLFFFAKKEINPPLIRSQNYMDEIGVDGLYSEVVLLN